MNLTPRWVGLLDEAGIGAVQWSSQGANNALDVEIVAYARANDCVVLTHDLDFSAILAATHGNKPCVVQIRADNVSPDVIGSQVIAAFLNSDRRLIEGETANLRGDQLGHGLQ